VTVFGTALFATFRSALPAAQEQTKGVAAVQDKKVFPDVATAHGNWILRT